MLPFQNVPESQLAVKQRDRALDSQIQATSPKNSSIPHHGGLMSTGSLDIEDAVTDHSERVSEAAYPEPTPTARDKRTRPVSELETGRKITAFEMVGIAGLQYPRAVHERWNVSGCVQPGRPKGLEYGLNIQNDAPDPEHPDNIVFCLEPGRWTKPPRLGFKTQRLNHVLNRAMKEAIVRDELREMRKAPARATSNCYLAISPETRVMPKKHRPSKALRARKAY